MNTLFDDERMAAALQIVYTNHRGETAVRNILPLHVEFKETKWHPEPQWILEAIDLDKNEQRSFAMKDIVEWGKS